MRINNAPLLLLTLIIIASIISPIASQAQKHDKGAMPLGQYEELADPKPHDPIELWTRSMGRDSVRTAWASTDVRYGKHAVPTGLSASRSLRKTAWRGERVNAQAVIYTLRDLDNVSLSVSDLRSAKGGVIKSENAQPYFVRYVMTDELNKDGNGGCGCRDNKADWDSSLVADVLDINKCLAVKRTSTQPIWLNIRVPRDAKPGIYEGTLCVSSKGMKDEKLKIELKVTDRELTEPSKWHLNIDLWQNPYAVARYYGVEPWSREHMDAMLPIMRMLADAGQQAITASIMHKPWNGQTFDPYDSMVTRIRHIDGTWTYSYAVFDKWVEFMTEEVGMRDALISCYTMIPWNLSFDYYDEATNRVKFVRAEPGDSAYAVYWGGFLRDFARHLRQKGWFSRTAISMDERPMEAMKAAIKVIKDADPDFKITLAGNYHDEIQQDLYYLSIPYGQKFPEEVLRQRRERGQISTYYTCCTEPFPGTFSFSSPAEAAWIGVHAVAADYDGYLRWAVNSWTEDPLRDTRFRTWAAGDTYSIYPGPRPSIRFERLVEGFQNAEKIWQLRQLYRRNGQKGNLKKLNALVSKFAPAVLSKDPAETSKMIHQLEATLNGER